MTSRAGRWVRLGVATGVLGVLGGLVPGAAARAGADARVDTATPAFSDPTDITNPYFPISTVTQVIQLGEEAGEDLRVEVTLLPEIREIWWNGRAIRARVSQFVAYANGRVVEVAYDYYAQDNDGSVWYLGEDVDNYRRGRIADHEGTWLAGRHGPPGMIMPAAPRPGDVYRPENIPGLVFEEVTVVATDARADGPTGPITDAVRVREHLMDGTTEEKLFARGYGEFRAEAPDELVTVALALPTDSLAGAPPAALEEARSSAAAIVETADSKQWKDLEAALQLLRGTWNGFRAANDVPALLDAQVDDTLASLDTALTQRNAGRIRQAANDLTGAILDVMSRYERARPVDFGRLGQWARQVLIDAAAKRPSDVAGDVAVLDAIWARTRSSVTDPAVGDEYQQALDALRVAAAGTRRAAVREAAQNVVSLSEGLGGDS